MWCLPDPSVAEAWQAAFSYDAARSADSQRTPCWGDGCSGVMTDSEIGLCRSCYQEITGNDPDDLL